MNPVTRLAGGVATAVALFALASPAFAGGSIKDKAEPRRCTLAANVGLTTDYVFRGISQSDEGPAVQGGFDATCGIFYAGVWASAIDFGATDITGNLETVAHLEVDFYLGIKPVTGKVTWDIGVIYYAYPGAVDPANGIGVAGELDYLEIKVGASGEIWKGGTLGVTAFYSPEYTGKVGETWTLETGFSQVLPKVGIFTPTFSALYGYQFGNNSAAYVAGFGDDHYSYWNAGVTFAFLEKWSLDVRYWDTDLASTGIAACGKSLFQCDERVVGTLKFSY